MQKLCFDEISTIAQYLQPSSYLCLKMTCVMFSKLPKRPHDSLEYYVELLTSGAYFNLQLPKHLSNIVIYSNIQLIELHFTKSDDTIDDILEAAIRCNKLDVLQHYISEMDPDSDLSLSELAAAYDRPEIFAWLYTKKLATHDEITQIIAESHHSLGVLKYLYDLDKDKTVQYLYSPMILEKLK